MEAATPESGAKRSPTLRAGSLPPNDGSFRAICMLFAQHPLYSKVPLSRSVEILDAVRNGTNHCLMIDGRLVGAILFKEISDEVARNAISQRRMPKAGEISAVPGRDALAATSFIAPSAQLVRPLWEHFTARYRSRLILYERHTPGRPTRFAWVDREGRNRGRAV
jgi:hypothetical protein